MIEMGRMYKDRISGFKGIAIGFCFYISGCSQVLLHLGINKDGELRESNWFDEQRLEPVGKSKITLDNSETPGFDKAAPKLS